jgi:predicted acyltransferase
MFIPVPGKGAGILTPDVNLATWFDQLVLGRFHHGENTWFLSYPGFGASVLLGVMAGHIIRLKISQKRRCLLLLLSGLGCIFTGLLWSFTFPVIKLMWTSSFVLLGGGFSFLMFSLFYWLTEIRGYTRWTFFFRVIGMNSITVYIMIMLFDFSSISNIFIGSLLPRTGNWAGFLSSAASLTVVWLILYRMYKKNTFLRL